jgi:hypothetical protein
VGEINTQTWRDVLESKCAKWSVDFDTSSGSLSLIDSNATPGLLNVYLPAPSADSKMREKDMLENDARFASIFENIMVQNYTVLYTTSPSPSTKMFWEEMKEYVMVDEADLPQEAMHVDLKRDLGRRAGGKVFENQTMVDGALFEKYQFLSPGMALICPNL